MTRGRWPDVVVAAALSVFGCGDVGDGRGGGMGDGGGDAAAPCETAADCGEPQIGPWSACDYATECGVAGARVRSIGTPVCRSSGLCGADVTTEMDTSEFCDRLTEGDECDEAGETYCGQPVRCRVCRAGACAANTPDFDAQCNPSCGAASTLCGLSGVCCTQQTTCPGASVGPGPWEAACPACCANSCI